MAKGPIGDKEVGAFEADGYVLVRGMLDAVEVGLLGRAAREDRVLDQHAFGRADGEGGTVRLSLWNHPTDTIYGMIARSESIVGSMEKLLGGEVYHYHSKMIMKDPLTGGAWTWHQDYGYWYHNGILKPWMGSAFIADNFGEPFRHIFGQQKLKEMRSFEREVTTLEIDWYLRQV